MGINYFVKEADESDPDFITYHDENMDEMTILPLSHKSQAEIDALTLSPSPALIFNETTGKINCWTGTEWKSLAWEIV